jgi:predicted RNA-binding Zn ribbon-like protein
VATQQEVDEIRDTSLHGGDLALDFVNTVDWRLAPQRRDLLPDHEVVLHWAHRMGIVSDAELPRFLREARSHPGKSRRALEESVGLRELLYRIFSASADGETPRPSDLRALNAVFADAVAHASLEPLENGFAWSWSESDPWHRVPWVVASAAVDLLSTGDLGRVKQCRDEGCGWLFLDMSKNASRRWCSMEGCGTRAKMRRQYRRKRAQRVTSQASS